MGRHFSRTTSTFLVVGALAVACASGEDIGDRPGAGGGPASDGAGGGVEAGAGGAGAAGGGGTSAGGGASGGGGNSGSTASGGGAGTGGLAEDAGDGSLGSGGVGGVSGAGGSSGAGIGGMAGGGNGGTGGTGGTGGMAGGGNGGNGGTSGTGGGAQTCPAGQFATGVSGGTLACASLDAEATASMGTSCSVYFGWADSCASCPDPPAKWGRANDAACNVGAGNNSSCINPVFDPTVTLLGLNTDGDVDSNDRFHLGLHCAAPTGATTQATGACAAGEVVVGVSGSQVTCTKTSDAVLDYVRQSCAVYLGSIDSCDGCSNPPTRWGRASDTICDAGVGTNGRCSSFLLGADTVNLASINTGGDVNDDDKFYVGLHCSGAQPATTGATGTCNAGQVVTGISGDGTLTCTSPAPAIEQAIQNGCWLYLGWRDSCDGCTTDPSKWGRVSSTACQNGAGNNSSCITAALGTEMVTLFGLNTDGDVGNDDKFYVGLHCP